jgi:hypothetical protein
MPDLLHEQMVAHFRMLRPLESIFRHWKMENGLLDFPGGWRNGW